MPLILRDEAIVELATRLATTRRVSRTEAVRQALEESIARDTPKMSVAERVRPLQDWFLSHPPTGKLADKAFYDELNGE